MEIKDLMIGDWVCYSEKPNSPTQVVNIGNCGVSLRYYGHKDYIFKPSLEDIQPIEITESLLLDNGFEKGESIYFGSELCSTYSLQFNDTFIDITFGFSNSEGKDWYCHIDNCAGQSIGGFDFQYVHEFQNGIRLITGKDLEVKL